MRRRCGNFSKWRNRRVTKKEESPKEEDKTNNATLVLFRKPHSTDHNF
jgi:hypothetical protein